ncbi:MAG: SEC-C metal-binding domain-containing protein [Bacteroidota bacterium]
MSQQGFKLETPDNANFSSIITPCAVSEAFQFIPGGKQPKTNQFNGLWDTGASKTVITQRVVDELGLVASGKVNTFHANGQSVVDTYYINIVLPNNVGFQYLQVSKGILHNFDVLIGMDIIGMGDFSITHVGKKSVFEFRMPSPESTRRDIADIKPPVNPPEPMFNKVGRNEPCPCGSGKKYKHCHG